MTAFTPALLGRYVYEALTGSPEVHALVHDRIYPLTTTSPECLPWIVYTDIECVYASTKDGSVPDSGSLAVVCACATYAGSVTMGDAVAACLNGRHGMRVSSMSSRYDPDIGYIVEIIINIEY